MKYDLQCRLHLTRKTRIRRQQLIYFPSLDFWLTRATAQRFPKTNQSRKPSQRRNRKALIDLLHSNQLPFQLYRYHAMLPSQKEKCFDYRNTLVRFQSWIIGTRRSKTDTPALYRFFLPYLRVYLSLLVHSLSRSLPFRGSLSLSLYRFISISLSLSPFRSSTLTLLFPLPLPLSLSLSLSLSFSFFQPLWTPLPLEFHLGNRQYSSLSEEILEERLSVSVSDSSSEILP